MLEINLVATRSKTGRIFVLDNVKQNVQLLVRKVIFSCGINIWSCKSTTMDNAPNSALMIACGVDSFDAQSRTSIIMEKALDFILMITFGVYSFECIMHDQDGEWFLHLCGKIMNPFFWERR